MTKISIGYATNDEDFAGDEQGYFLEKVLIEEIQSAKTWTFNCNRWLAINGGDGLTIIDLKPESVFPARFILLHEPGEIAAHTQLLL